MGVCVSLCRLLPRARMGAVPMAIYQACRLEWQQLAIGPRGLPLSSGHPDAPELSVMKKTLTAPLLRHCPGLLALLLVLLLQACAAPKYTVDDGRALDPKLLEALQSFGAGEQALRPAITRSAQVKDPDCDHQWELPISVASSAGWSEDERVAWVRSLRVDERLTVLGSAPGSGLEPGEKLVEIDGSRSNDAESMLKTLASLRDRGRPFVVRTATGRSVQISPVQVCRGYVRMAPPNTPLLQEYHWLMSYHPLEVARAELSSDEALWVVLWTQALSEEGGVRMKAYHYGTSILSSLYTVATIATGLRGAAMAAEAAIKTAQQAASTVASEILKQQLVDQAKQFAIGRVRDEVGKTAQALTQAQVVASLQVVAANRGSLLGVSRVAATVFDQADARTWRHMKQLGANPLAGFALHQKMLERALLANALVLDADRLEALQALATKDGQGEAAVAILKGIRPEAVAQEIDGMPLASSTTAFSYEEPVADNNNPYAFGLVEAMLGMPDTGPVPNQAAKPAAR